MPEPPGQPPIALTEASFTDFKEVTSGETEPRLCWLDNNCIVQCLRVTLHRESKDSQQISPTTIRRNGSFSKGNENSFILSHSPSWSTTQPRITYDTSFVQVSIQSISAWRSNLRGSSYSGNTEGYLAPMITNTQPLTQEGIDACDLQIGHGYWNPICAEEKRCVCNKSWPAVVAVQDPFDEQQQIRSLSS